LLKGSNARNKDICTCLREHQNYTDQQKVLEIASTVRTMFPGINMRH